MNQRIIAEMRNNLNVTKVELSRSLGISTTAMDNNTFSVRRENV